MKSFVQLLPLVIILVAMAAIALASRHKKIRNDDVPFIGGQAVVNSKLNPEGTVIFRGEVWRARTSDDVAIEVDRRVKIIGVQDHLLVVGLL